MLLLLPLPLWLLLPPAPSFVKITQEEVLGLCPVPTAHTSSLMSEAWWVLFVLFCFLHEFPRVAEWGERAKKSRVSERRGRVVSDAAGFGSCLLNKIFSGLIQKTCTVELWVELFLYREFCLKTRL